jgi:hypothetical protein
VLNFDQLDILIAPLMELYERYQMSVIKDIARRLAKLKTTHMAAWQMQRLIEAGLVYEHALEELSKLTGKSVRELRRVFQKAGVKSVTFDDAIYKAAGLKPTPLNLSPAMTQVLAAGLRKTGGVIRNLTMSTASSAQNAFIDAADLAYMQVSSGAFDYNTAIRNAVIEVANKGLSTIGYASGRKDQLDVAVRRTVLTGVSQTAGELTEARLDEMGTDLVQTSAHIGARNKGDVPENHELWQGRVFSRMGNPDYPNFYEITGYGTVVGLYGINCRHSHHAYYPGISDELYNEAMMQEYASKTVIYNGQEMSWYDATQKQREIERKIRYWKRQEEALKAAGLDASAETAKVREWQARMRDFTKQTGLYRQYERERIMPLVPVENVDRDLQLAQQGSLFDLTLKETETIFSQPFDLSERYNNEKFKSERIIFDEIGKDHTWRIHKNDREWFSKNQDLVLRTIQNPIFVDSLPRDSKQRGINIAHVFYIGETGNPFLTVVINFKNNRAKIWTMFRANNQYIFYEDGTLKDRWMKAK